MAKKFQETITEIPAGCEEWAEVIRQLDTETNRNERTETRRHSRLYGFKDGEEYEIEIEDTSVDIVGGFLAEESYSKLLDFVRGFSDRQQRLVFLLEDGLSIREIAEELGMAEKAVYKMREKIREKIKSFKQRG